NGLLLSFVSYAVFLIFGLFFVRPFFELFTKDAELIQLGTDYLSICSTYSLGVFLAITGERLLQATGKSSLSMISQLAGALTNIILDPILIFGWYGAPEMGIKGAAIATVIGQFVGCFMALALNYFCNREIRFEFKGYRPHLSTILDIYRVGVPVIVLNALGSVMTIGMNGILIAYSTTAVAVFGAYYKLNSFIFMPVFGLVQGLVPIVGYNYGARRPDRIVHAVRLSLISAVSIMVVGMLAFLLFPQTLLGIFKAGPEMLSIGTLALRVISITFPLAAIGIVLSNMFQGIGIGTISLVNSFLRQIVVLLPAAFLLARWGGLDLVWYAFLISESISLTYSIVMYKKVYELRIQPLFDETRFKEQAEMEFIAGSNSHDRA
ncbi:MAG: MATE family efflux transporter, partial [Oscillospiraceae bacterium]